jgi:uncharacterized protein (TIGR02996 family)
MAKKRGSGVLDVGGDLMNCTVEQAGMVCEQLLASGLQKTGLPITGVGHGPRARFRWLRKEPLQVFIKYFDSAHLSVARGVHFEQVVVVRALGLLGCDVKRHSEGCRRKEYVSRLLLQRQKPGPEEAGLQEAVNQGRQGNDWTPCLVYADWLEEHGHAYLAARFRNVKAEALA